jgi:hypothetical protein
VSDRLNIIFHNEATGDAYCLLALRNLELDADQAPLQRLLTAMIERIDEHSQGAEPCMSALAADIVTTLASKSQDADLLPAAAPWLADITVHVRTVNGEFLLSCKKMDLSHLNLPDLGPDTFDAIDGFEGNADQLRDLVNQIDWN